MSFVVDFVSFCLELHRLWLNYRLKKKNKGEYYIHLECKLGLKYKLCSFLNKKSLSCHLILATLLLHLPRTQTN